MMVINLRQVTLTIFMATAVFLAGCSSGDGGGSKNNSAAPPSLSRSTAIPGEFITINHSSIISGSTVDVTFSGNNGYTVTFQSNDTDNGQVNVPVPVLINPEDGAVLDGDVSVKLAGVNGTNSLYVNTLPLLQGIAPGDVLIEVLVVAIDNYVDTIENLDIIAARENVDNTDAVAQIETRIADLESMIEEILIFGDLEVELPDGTFVIVSPEKLELVDRILTSSAAGMVEHLSPTPALLKANPQQGLISFQAQAELPPIIQDPLGTISQMAQDTKNQAVRGLEALGGGMGAIVTVGGLMIGGVPGAVLAVIGGTAVIIAVAGTEISVSVSANNLSNALRQEDAEQWDSSQELIDITKNTGQNLIITIAPLGLPKKVGDALSTLSAADGVQTFIENTAEDSCNSNSPQGSQLRIFNNKAEQVNTADFCRVVLGTPPPEPGNGSGFTINNIVNLNGENIINPTAGQIAAADISISGTPEQFSISWTLSNAASLFVIKAGEISASYGIFGEEVETDSGSFLRPFNPPVQYGNYSIFGTVPFPSAQIPAPVLQTGASYGVTVGNEAGDQALLSFTVQ